MQGKNNRNGSMQNDKQSTQRNANQQQSDAQNMSKAPQNGMLKNSKTNMQGQRTVAGSTGTGNQVESGK